MTTTQHSKRFRLRFSIRTLAIIVTLVCCYAACWGPTKRWGVEDVTTRAKRGKRNPILLSVAIAPCFVRVHEQYYFVKPAPPSKVIGMARYTWVNRHRYYFWFFGYVTKLPYERDVGIDWRGEDDWAAPIVKRGKRGS